MADIGNLVTYLRLNDDQFNRNLKRSADNLKSNAARMNRAMSKVEQGFNKISKRVLNYRTVMAGAAAAAGMGYFIKRQLEVADSIGKTADKIGVGVEALQEYRHAAELSGVEMRTADMALQRFSRRMGEAAQGTGEALNVVEKYGIQVRDSNGQMRSNMDIMGDWAEVIKNAESEQEALRIAFKLFDSEGAAMVNMLRGGKGAMVAFREDARKLGIVLEDDLVRNSEEANDQVTRLSRVISVQFTRAVAEAAPEIAKVTKQLTESGKIQEYAKSVISVAKAFLQASMWAADFFNKVGQGLGIAGARLAGGKDSPLEHVESNIAKIEQRVKRLRDSLSSVPGDYIYRDQLEQELKSAEQRLKILSKTRQDILSDMAKTGKTETPASVTPLPTASIPKLKQVNKQTEQETKQHYEQMKSYLFSFHDAAIEKSEAQRDLMLESMEEEVKAFGESRDEIMNKLFGHHDAVLQVQQAQTEMAIDNMEKVAKAGKKTFGEDLQNAFTGWANNWSSTLNDMLWGAEVTFNNILKSFGQMITQMTIQKSVVEPIASAGSSIASGIGSWISGLFEAHGGAYSGGRRLAYDHGGIVRRPTMFATTSGMGLMGEARPEAILPLTRTSGGDLGVKGAGGGVSIQVINNSGQEANVKETKRANGGRDIKIVIGEMVAGDIRSGGQIHRSIRDVFGASPSIIRR